MNKLVSLVLALALALSLAAPALAEEAEAPMWKTVGYDSLEALLRDDWAGSEAAYYAYLAAPAERAAFVAAYRAKYPDESAVFDFDAAYAAHLDAAYTTEEVLELLELTTQAQLEDLIFCLWLEEAEKAQRAQADWADLQTEQPERVALFLAQMDQYLQDEWGYDSMEAFLALDASSLEEGYLYLFEDWNTSYEYEREAQAQRDALITALGGVPGQMNIMAGRRCLSFGDRTPKLADGTLSVPADVLERALGVPVKGDAQGYAPLRTSAEGAGWDVLWDQEHQTAVLLNGPAISAQLDKNFTQLSALGARLLKAFQFEAGQSYHTEGQVDFSITLFDSLDGDKTYDLRFRGALDQKDGALSGKLTMDLSSLAGLITADQVKERFGQGRSLAQLAGLVKDCTVEFILNPETETLYLKIPLLAQLMDSQAEQLGGWLSLPLVGYASLLDQSTPLSLGSAIYQKAYLGADDEWSGSPIGFYGDLDRLSQSYISLLGNARFTEQNGALTYRLDTKMANDLWNRYMTDQMSWYGEMGDGPDLFRSCDVTIGVGQSGKVTAKVDVRFDSTLLAMADYYDIPVGGTGDFQVQMHLARTAEQLKAGLEFHWQNRISVTMTETNTVRKTDTAPLATPPQGEAVVAMDMLAELLSQALMGR